jgi:PAS domain S-box-containing protein
VATILIVDDLAANREFLVTLLRYQGHLLLEAMDGRMGLAIVQDRHPDLVITDVLMPVMDGYELVRQLRLDPATAGTPVIFYTAHYGAREARDLALSSGVACVLPKPSEPEEVLKVVSSVLTGTSGRAAPLPAPLSAEFDREHMRLLTDKLSENVEDLRSANARLRALINIGLELASERDGEHLLESVCLAARELFGATYVTLGILHRANGTIDRVVTHGVSSADWWKVGDDVSGIIRTVVTERRPVRGVNTDGRPGALNLPTLHPEIRHFLSAPIASPARVYGWLCLVANEGRAFTQEDEQLILALSGQVGRIYENGCFYAEAQKRAAELEFEMAEREKAVNALREAEERMRFALQNADIGIWDINYATGVVKWSEILERQYGLLPGSFPGTFEAFIERVHPDDRAATTKTIQAALQAGAEFTVQNRSVWPDGTVRWLNGSGRALLGGNGEPVRAVGISIDVTERRTLEEQFRQAQKMEAVGRLAGGVAHDFNNVLSVILSYSEMLMQELKPIDPMWLDLNEIKLAGERATALTRQLLAFSRQQVIERAVIDLNDTLKGCHKMLQRLVREDVQLVTRLADDLGKCLCDAGQLEQVVMNLVVNACDAMPGGGRVTLETTNVEIDEDYGRTHFGMKPGPYVMLAVSDTGVGMDKATEARIFEPFFTTKAKGLGTGLGLSTVFGIVDQSGGSVRVYTEPGNGTTFKIYLPRTDQVSVAVVPSAPAGTLRGTETILLVEDEDQIRSVARGILQRHGYTVLEARNAGEALLTCEQYDQPIHLLLTDVVMPQMSGKQLADRLAPLRPDMKILFMSGYTDGALDGQLQEGAGFLQKPLTPGSLTRKVRSILDAGGRKGPL